MNTIRGLFGISTKSSPVEPIQLSPETLTVVHKRNINLTTRGKATLFDVLKNQGEPFGTSLVDKADLKVLKNEGLSPPNRTPFFIQIQIASSKNGATCTKVSLIALEAFSKWTLEIKGTPPAGANISEGLINSWINEERIPDIYLKILTRLIYDYEYSPTVGPKSFWNQYEKILSRHYREITNEKPIKNSWTTVLTNRGLLVEFLQFLAYCKESKEESEDQSKRSALQNMLTSGKALTEQHPELTIPVKKLTHAITDPRYRQNYISFYTKLQTLVKEINEYALVEGKTMPSSPKADPIAMNRTPKTDAQNKITVPPIAMSATNMHLPSPPMSARRDSVSSSHLSPPSPKAGSAYVDVDPMQKHPKNIKDSTIEAASREIPPETNTPRSARSGSISSSTQPQHPLVRPKDTIVRDNSRTNKPTLNLHTTGRGTDSRLNREDSKIHLGILQIPQDQSPVEDRTLDDELFMALTSFLETAENALLRSITTVGIDDSGRKKLNRQNTTVKTSIPKAQNRILNILGDDGSIKANVIRTIINQITDYVNSTAQTPFSLQTPRILPLEDRLNKANGLLEQLQITVPQDATPLFERQDFYQAFDAHLTKALSLRREYLKLLLSIDDAKDEKEKEVRYNKLQQTTKLIQRIQTQLGNLFMNDSYQRTWSGIINLGNKISQSIIPSNTQLITDQFLLTCISKEQMLREPEKYSKTTRNFQKMGNDNTPAWKRALLVNGYGPLFNDEDSAYTCFKITCDAPFVNGIRHFQKGTFTIGYAYPTRRKAFKVSFELDISALELSLDDTQKLLSALQAFLDLTPERALEFVASTSYLSDFANRELVKTIFVEFRRQSDVAFGKVFFTATGSENCTGVIDESERMTELSRTINKCDQTLRDAKLEKYLTILNSIYSQEICTFITDTFTGIPTNRTTVAAKVEGISIQLYPDDEETSKREKFVSDLMQSFDNTRNG